MVDNSGKRNRRLKVDPGIQAHIGQQLRAMYDEVASQPVPDDLIRLLDAMGESSPIKIGNDASDEKKSGSNSPERA